MSNDPQLPPSLKRDDLDRDMPLTEHLDELRRRILISAGFFFIAVILSMTRVQWIIRLLKRPAGDSLERFAFFAPAEAFVAHVKVACLGAIVISMPVLLWQLWLFIRRGLTRKERSLGMLFVGWGSLQFALGALFAYFVLLPVSLGFLLGVGRDYLDAVISIDRYLSFVAGLIFWSGMVFQIPVVLYLLARLGIVTPEWLKQSRPYAVLVMVTAAALLTPTTDVVNLALMTLPMLLLYEFSIIVCRIGMRRER